MVTKLTLCLYCLEHMGGDIDNSDSYPRQGPMLINSDNNKTAADKETMGYSIGQQLHAILICAMLLASLLHSLTLPSVR